MSMFLGPIHYWLYNKIRNQERLTKWLTTKAGVSENYTKELPELENVIDESNIHGWLQAQIIDAEERYSKLVNELITSGMTIDEIESKAFEFGKENRVEVTETVSDVYKYFEDFFVNGMPCDHVNIVTDKGEDYVSWEMVQDIHASYWQDGDSTYYYKLRKAVMDGLLEGSGYEVIMSDSFHYTIRKI